MRDEDEKASSVRFGDWKIHLALAMGGLIGLSVIYARTIADLVDVWARQSTYNYSFFVPLITIYLIYDNRERLRDMAPRVDPLGIVWTAFFALIWLVADSADINIGRQIGFIGLLQGVILGVFGRQLFRTYLLPILYLWLCVPMWEFMITPLQQVTLELSYPLVEMAGIPVFVDGLLIEVPSGLYRVAPECSGLNFLLAAAALSVLFGYLMYNGWRKQLSCFLIGMAVAVLANGVRVALIIVYNHYVGDSITIGGDHLTWGWGFFAIIVLVMIGIGSRFADSNEKSSEDGAPGQAAVSAQSKGAMTVVAGLLVLMAAAPSAYSVWLGSQLDKRYAVALALPDSIGGYETTAVESRWAPYFPSADWSGKRAYRGSDGGLELFVAYYALQNPQREMISFGNSFAGEGGEPMASNRKQAASLAGRPIDVIESRIRTGGGTRLIWSWYWVDGRYTASRSLAKMLQAKTNLINGDRRAAAIALSSPVDTDLETVRARMQALLEAAGNLDGILEVSVTEKP